MKPRIKILNSIFEVAHVEFQFYDVLNHKLIFSSGLIHSLLGYTEDEYRALSVDFYKKIIHPDDFNKVQQAIDKIIKSQDHEVFEMTIRLLKSNGNYVWVYSRQMVYERNPNGHVLIVIREVEDVTRLVELEDELAEKVKQLQIVTFKNSHLVRSPVASIIGLVDLIEEHGITGDHNKQIFQYLKAAISKLDEVIHEINAAAQIK